MAFKVVVSNPKDGKSYQVEVDGASEKRLTGMKIGDTFKGDIVGLTDYELEITGGSNKSGFPMKKGVDAIGQKRVLLSSGVGYNPKKDGMRKKKTVHTEEVTEIIVQINSKIVKEGKKPVEDILGKKEEETEEAKEE